MRFYFASLYHGVHFAYYVNGTSGVRNSLCKDLLERLIPLNRLYILYAVNRPLRNDIDINHRYKYRTSTDIYIQVDRVSICDIPQLSRYNRLKREIIAESISELGTFLLEHGEIFGEQENIAGDMLLDPRFTIDRRHLETRNNLSIIIIIIIARFIFNIIHNYNFTFIRFNCD